MRTKDMVRVQYGRGSYMPTLMRVLQVTRGPIVELGAGYVSTPYLHWVTYESKRPVVTYESDPEWYQFASKFGTGHHTVHFVEDWDKVDLSFPYEVSLVDHSPSDRRAAELRKLTHVPFVVIHDTENSSYAKYRLHRAHGLYKYRMKIGHPQPSTSVWSNIHDVGQILIASLTNRR